ncbi:hypothetical protein [uncultured Winogradskyella sp.]|uniref:hypothetical protein n=1 Tax=uncultured Winogradskyella sp. TaxID=395353 RepID=UPI00260A52BC|nr:hypothetical protein [uncultured Winogradskyella sp.]
MKAKQLTTLIVCIGIAMAGYSQKTYLKITKSKKANDYEMYPPGTKFELKNEQGYIVFKNSDQPGIIEIDEDYTLYIYPTWKEDADIFELTEGKVEKILADSYSEEDSDDHSIKSNGISANYTVSDSKEREGKKNLEFKLSNGITFIYEDDKYRAYLNEKHNYIRIEGKYLIQSEIGTLKVSFNPNNGVVWWVFEPVKE